MKPSAMGSHKPRHHTRALRVFELDLHNVPTTLLQSFTSNDICSTEQIRKHFQSNISFRYRGW